MVFATVQAGAQSIFVPQHVLDSVANPPVDRNPSLVFERESVDAGRLSEDDAPVTFGFPFRNVGDKPLVVTKVVTTCGCAVAHFDRKPVLPGDTARIAVTYDPKGHPGQIQRRIFIYTSASSAHPSARLEITGEVVAVGRFTGYPARLGTLAAKRRKLALEVRRGEILTERIECVNTGTKALRLRAVTGMCPAWLAFRTEPSVIDPGKTADLVVTVDGRYVPDSRTDGIECLLPIEGLDGRPTERSLHITLKVSEN